MNQLVIKLTGVVDSSNFDEWKKDLIFQIRSTNTELVSDNDFSKATKQVKSFKSAEKLLKQAKQSAIDQAESIQNLFSAIDDITEEARQARLSLERQIKARKLEIKNQYIQAGINEIEVFINDQVDELKYIDTSNFTDRSRFESAVSGKAGVKGLKNAIDKLCSVIRSEISAQVIDVNNNKAKIYSLPEEQKILFQDWKLLLGLSENEIDLEIDKRIAKYNEKILQNKIERKDAELKRIKGLESNPKTEITADDNKRDKYQIIIELLSTQGKAKEFARVIKGSFGDDQLVDKIRLKKA